MKFSEKYELLESLTTGVIETFVANDKVRSERVLVHIVDCAPPKPDQTTAEWALESFRRLAPEPPGPILETGKYSGTKYAYVVSKPADETAVKAWVRRYELHAQETKETRVHPVKPEIAAPAPPPPVAQSSSPPAQIAPKDAPPAYGTMTQLLRDFDSLSKPRAPEAAASQAVPRARSGPSTAMPGESGLHAAPPWEPASAKSVTPSKETPFAPPVIPEPIAPEPPLPVRDTAKPGEFTNFFQGPFRGDRSTEMPAFSSQPVEPPKKSVGDFTALFGQAGPAAPAAPSSANISEPSFTSIFKDMPSAQPTFNSPSPAQGPVIPPAASPMPSAPPVNVASLPDPVFVAPTPIPVVTPTPPPQAIPATPNVVVEKPVPSRPASLHGDGATGAFMRPTVEPAPVPIQPPSGPSPYTQIISRPQMAEPLEAEAGHAPPAAGGANFNVPPMPMIPAAVPPPILRIPPPPPMIPPPMVPPPAPRMKAPQTPKAPKADAPAQPPVSMWPLIITLTVLFFLAVILVLFFVLKH